MATVAMPPSSRWKSKRPRLDPNRRATLSSGLLSIVQSTSWSRPGEAASFIALVTHCARTPRSMRRSPRSGQLIDLDVQLSVGHQLGSEAVGAG